MVGWYAITRGDIDRLLVPTNTEGLKCGVDSEVKDEQYLLFFNLAKCVDPTVAITGCPTRQVMFLLEFTYILQLFKPIFILGMR